MTLHRGGRKQPLTAAWGAWNGNSFQNIEGEQTDPYVQLIMRGTSSAPMECEAFARLAEELYKDVLEEVLR